jgi:hypothetical protein
MSSHAEVVKDMKCSISHLLVPFLQASELR